MLRIGYCTNVHSGVTLNDAKRNLSQYSSEVRNRLIEAGELSTNEPLGIGLWLAAPAAEELAGSPEELSEFKEWLAERHFSVFTINGFPQDNFHQETVKHSVYHPTWWEPERLQYTRNLAKILAQLIPEGQIGSISTLPICWSTPQPTGEQVQTARSNLIQLASELATLKSETGKEIVIAIEAEPGCWLGDSSAVRLFLHRNFLFPRRNKDLSPQQIADCRTHLTICHDICHAAVMYEDQRRELLSYRELGIRIGKVQVSSAIGVDWDRLGSEEKVAAFNHLQEFAEDKYLHQTTTRGGPVGSVRLTDDLATLIEPISAPERLVGNWRVHFHVPIMLDSISNLETTQNEIQICLESLLPQEDQLDAFTGHFEVETYAWNVLPPAHLPTDGNEFNLASGIAQEMQFLLSSIKKCCSANVDP